MKSSLLRVWLVIAILAAGSYAAYSAWRAYRAQNGAATAGTNAHPERVAESRIVLDGSPRHVRPVEEYRLVERSGANFRSEHVQGHVWVANIFFSSCNLECRRLTEQMLYLQQTYPQLRIVSMTCDPDVDTPEKLRDYAKQHQADPTRWFFVTGSLSDAARFSEDAWGERLKGIKHTSRIVLVDRDGTWRGSFNVMDERDLQQLEEGIQTFLHSKAQPPEPA